MSEDFLTWTLRPPRTDDAARLVTLAGDPSVANWMFNFPLDAAFFERILAKECTWIVDIKGACAGVVSVERGADVYSLNASISGFVDPAYRGRGIYTDAREHAQEWIWNNTDAVRIHSQIFESNRAMVRVLEKLGYTLDGRLRRRLVKNGIVMDELVYSLMKGEG